MNKSADGVFAIVASILVIYTAMINPVVSVILAGMAIVGYFIYQMMFTKKVAMKTLSKENLKKRRAVTKKTLVAKKKKK